MINFNLKKYKNPYFIETGTGAGLGINKALKAGFRKIYSIELVQELYLRAGVAFKKERDAGIVDLRIGDSVKVLPVILEEIEGSVTFWLDAHADSPRSVRRNKNKCPLYEELDIIKKYSNWKHTIMIDDRRLFADNETRENANGWGQEVTECGIIERIKSINNSYTIIYEDGFQEKDVIIAYIS